jgi:Ferritin-like domain
MNIIKIIEDVEKFDPEVGDKLSRKDMFKKSGSIGSKIARAAAPLILGSLFTKRVYGRQGNESVAEVLQYALTLEYLESEFYTMGLAADSLIPADRMAIFQQISNHESDHVTFLKSVLNSMSVTPVTKPTFDFTAGGTYGDVFTNYQTFLALSQAFEDIGVRAYKGRAVELMGNDVVLTAALQIHSVEARHASMVRRLRAEKGWITGETGSPAAVYDGENNLVQGGADITSLGYSAAIATEAFDEPLAPAAVLDIAGLFIVTT